MEIAPWLAEQIEAHAPDRDADPAAAGKLAEAYGALVRGSSSTQAFGLAIPDDLPNRDALRARALELLKLWLARLDADGKDKIRQQLAGYGLPTGSSAPAKSS